MKQHALRFKLITAGLIVSLLVVLALTVAGQSNPALMETQIYGSAGSAFVFFLAAFADALGVERRRRTPGIQALEDDISPSPREDEDEDEDEDKTSPGGRP